MTTPPPADAPKVQAPSEAVRKAMKNYLDTCTQHRERDPEDPTGLDDQVWFAERDLIEAISAEARAENLDWKAAWYALDQDCKAKTRPAPVADGIEESVMAAAIDAGVASFKQPRQYVNHREGDRRIDVGIILRAAAPIFLASAHQREAELREVERIDKALLQARVVEAEAERDRLKEALTYIRDLDYRGNRHPSAEIALRALLTREEAP